MFDLEFLFIIPFAVEFKDLLRLENSTGILYGTIAFVTIMFFLATVVVGLIYEWKKGAFDWSEQARSEGRAEAAKLKKQTKARELEAVEAA